MSPTTRDKIVDAAMAIIREQGVSKLTLDAAAKAARMSKGGVLYHFKSKDDLIRAMVQRMIESCEGLKLDLYQREPDGPYRHARAVVRTMFDRRGPAYDPIGGALLAPFHAKFREWLDEIASDSPDPALSALVSLAMDGYMFGRMLKLPTHDDDMLERIRQTALDLLK